MSLSILFSARSLHPYSFLYYTFPFPRSFYTFHHFKFGHFTFRRLLFYSALDLYHLTALFFPKDIYFSCLSSSHGNTRQSTSFPSHIKPAFAHLCMWPVWVCAPCRCPGSRVQRGWPGSLQRCPCGRCPPSVCEGSGRLLPSPSRHRMSERKCTIETEGHWKVNIYSNALMGFKGSVC